MPPLVVGIDLGTTHTVVAFTELGSSDKPRVFAIPQLVTAGETEAQALLPSFLYSPLEGESIADPFDDAPWVIGQLARQRGEEIPGRLVSSAKSWLCHPRVDRTAAILPWGARDGETPRISPVDASARLLGHVSRTWNARNPKHPLEKQQVVLTVPASFDQAARALTLRAAHAAGLNVRLLEEPQAAFYDHMSQQGLGALESLTEQGDALVLVCDVGGGTTDLTLIRVAHQRGALDVERVAVGRHLLLGGDNMDLALAHLCEARLAKHGERLDPQRFGQLTLACRTAKERLLGDDPPEQVHISLAGKGSSLVGSTLRTELSREDAERVVLEGFLPRAPRDAQLERSRTGLLAFGLPYEQDPAITRHVAQFFERHAHGSEGPRGLLLNGGLFRASRIAARLGESIQAWGGPPLTLLPHPDPDMSVARGAVVFGLAAAGHGLRIGGGAARGYYVGIESGEHPRALCVVPRGAREGERHLVPTKLALKVGQPVRFELYAADSGKVHAPGELVSVEGERFERLPPLLTTVEASDGRSPPDSERRTHSASAASASPASSVGEGEVHVALEGELSATGTVDLHAVEADATKPRRFALAFDLRGEPESAAESRAPSSLRTLGKRLADAREAIERVFGKGRSDVKEREVKDLWRELERLLGERREWDGELCRALFDTVGPKHKARRRSADHERVYWMLAGFCLRPGFGHPRDPQRVAVVAHLWEQGLTFQQEARVWQQFFIAWRRVAAGLGEPLQTRMRNRLDPFLAPGDQQPKKPKGFKPQALDELLELASWLERVPVEARVRLGQWLLDRTWTDRDPRIWGAIGRIGARIPAYASVHHVVPPRTAERWLDHLLREKWEEMPSAARAAMQMARVTGDRARDVSDATRQQVALRLEKHTAPPEWARAVRGLVPVQERELAETFGEDLPVGLRLAE